MKNKNMNQPILQQVEPNSAFTRSSTIINNLEPKKDTNLADFARKDLSEEIKVADEFKVKMDDLRTKDPLKDEITILLNNLIIDNYKEIKSSIFNLIKEDTLNQEKLIDVLFKKNVYLNFPMLYYTQCYVTTLIKNYPKE